jgi:nucleotide-binding universal stress UspA family protein
MLRIQKILFPTDLSPSANQPFSYARVLGRCLDARITALTVQEAGSEQDASRAIAEEELRLALAPAGDAHRLPASLSVAIETAASPADGIVKYAADHEIDLMVVGLKDKRRRSTTIRGGLAYELIRRSPCPVLTVRESLPSRGVERVLVPIDFSEMSRQAVATAREVAHLFGARLEVVHVLSSRWEQASFTFTGSNRPRPELAREWEEAVMRFVEDVPGPEVDITPVVRVGSAAPTIVNVSLEMRSDLLVIATHGNTGREESSMGSVAESVISCSPCPVLSVKSFGRSPLVASLEPAEELDLPPAEPVAEPAVRKPRRLGVPSRPAGG